MIDISFFWLGVIQIAMIIKGDNAIQVKQKIKLLQQIYLFTARFGVQLPPVSGRSIFSVNLQKTASLSL